MSGIDKATGCNEGDCDLSGILSAFKSTKSRQIVIRELMILVHIDDKYDNKEHELTSKIVEYVNINEKDLKYFKIAKKRINSIELKEGVILKMAVRKKNGKAILMEKLSVQLISCIELQQEKKELEANLKNVKRK